MTHEEAVKALRDQMETNSSMALGVMVLLRACWENADDRTQATWLKFWQVQVPPEWLTTKLDV